MTRRGDSYGARRVWAPIDRHCAPCHDFSRRSPTPPPRDRRDQRRSSDVELTSSRCRESIGPKHSEPDFVVLGVGARFRFFCCPRTLPSGEQGGEERDGCGDQQCRTHSIDERRTRGICELHSRGASSRRDRQRAADPVPIALACSSAGKFVVMTDNVTGITIAAPTPARTRSAISTSTLPANPDATFATMKTTSPASKIGLRPHRSPIAPTGISRAASVRV